MGDSTLDKRLERILPRVQKPARYTGGEYNAVKKDPAQVDTRIAFCFPDTYEIGMSNLGMRILYGVMNNMEGVWCQRVFAPWGDMEEEMRRAQIPLFALESGEPIADFDIVAFSVGYEMAFTAILNMLDLAGIPMRSAERTDLTPLVIAGGTAMYNAEPIADFVDIVSLGEGEDVTVELIELHRKARKEGWSKAKFLHRAAQVPGLYVPSLYEVDYNEDGTVREIRPQDGAPKVVRKRIVEDMDKSYYPAKTIVPSTEIVQDRVTLELFRGCIRGCRFCQAGYVYRPVRNRSKDLCVRYGVEACNDSGYQEVTLSSLSTSDYPQLTELCDDLENFCKERHVNLSLPSLRADNFSMSLMQRLAKGRKTGLTFAPEAGTQRLRDVINKNVTQEELLASCRTAFAGGYNAVKLYFMLGLPTETDEDVLGIADLAARVMHAWRESAANKQRGVRITVSTSWFVPKPHTAFQWEPQISKEEYERRVKLLREAITTKTVTYNWHDSDTSFLEAVLARGDRRMCKVLETAWRKGAKLDAWEEYFSLERWLEAFDECGLDPHFYANRQRQKDEIMPWSMISSGVTEAYLWRELQQAKAGVTTPDCRTHCNGCGANLMVGGTCHV
ncbi:MAG: TIGR03960 family B12-binding radical SAM protein [Clostridiales bacterium]|nr:TIGR03960 family B12-binding radical SAM protein [Clostridiales bacterium]